MLMMTCNHQGSMLKTTLILINLASLGIGTPACDQADSHASADRTARLDRSTPDQLRLSTVGDAIDERRTVAGAHAMQLRQLDRIDHGSYLRLGDFEVKVPDIVNGVPTFAHGNTGALLENVGGRLETLCSGTMIGCETFLTANHCFRHSRNSDIFSVFLPSEGIIPVEYVYPEHDDYEHPSPVADFALVKLSNSISVVSPVALNADDKVNDQTAAKIVGYGRTGSNNDDDGVKRAGAVVTSLCPFPEEGLICWEFNESVASTCYLDSGGPMLVKGAGDILAVAGVTASGDEDCDPGSTSIDVDVRHYADWILAQAGADISLDSCGIVASRPGGGTALLEKSDELSSGQSHHYALILDSDIAEVRIGLNGTDNHDNDFNLAVSVSSGAGGDIDGCADNTTSNYAYCKLSLTETQTNLSITVSQKEGGGPGQYQMLVTALSAADILR